MEERMWLTADEIVQASAHVKDLESRIVKLEQTVDDLLRIISNMGDGNRLAR